MTSETRTLIEASDIAAIEIECTDCRLTISYPVAVKEIIRIGPACPHCNHRFFDPPTGDLLSGNRYPAIDAIQEIAANLRKLTRSDRTDIHAKIRFQIIAGQVGAT